MSNKTVDFVSYADNVENYLYIDVLSDKMAIGARRGLNSASKNIVKITKDAIKNPPKTGIKYPNLRVRSSRAGEFPANQTGKLRRSVGYQLQGVTRSFIGANAHYARYLAFGTRKIEKRAFIGNVIKDNITKSYDTISNEINKELNI